jgi:hypothetical protein
MAPHHARNTLPDTSPDASEEDKTTVSDTEDNYMVLSAPVIVSPIKRRVLHGVASKINALSNNNPTLLAKHDSNIVGM